MIAARHRFLRVDGRYVHCLVAGRGAPVLLIHGSPNSAETVTPMIEALASDFLVIAADTPGNGASDPLDDANPNAEFYADACLALLDNLHIGKVCVYGFHTGAVFAAELARRYPERVSALVCDGFPVWTNAEADKLDDAYLASVSASDDGAHLARIWSRVVDQNRFFPWHIQTLEHAIDSDLDNVDRLHARAMDFLVAGDSYRAPYAAALKPDGRARIAALGTPTLCTVAASDVLADHLDRVPHTNSVTTCTCADAATTRRKTADWFKQHAPATARVEIPSLPRRFVDLPGGQLYVCNDEKTDRLWLHDAGASSAQNPDLADASIDLPGHGLSTLAFPADKNDVLALLRDCIAAAGFEHHQMDGTGLGARLARSLSTNLIPAPIQEQTAPDIRARWDGGHLHAAWHFCRFRNLYAHWNARQRGQKRPVLLPDRQTLHQQTVDVLRAGHTTMSQALSM